MSEIINRNNELTSRLELLITVSAAALMASLCVSQAAADDADRPTVWVELGGQVERIDSTHTLFAPAFFSAASSVIKPVIDAPMIDSQHPPGYGIGGEGKITFVPEGSDWVFSASVRFGRGNSAKHLHHEVDVSTATQAFPSSFAFFGDGQTEFHESHTILDFMAGKDVGLGMFGTGSKSVVSAGVRFAQFNSSSDITLHARPYVHNSSNPLFPGKYNLRNRFRTDYTATEQGSRNTRAIGPSLSWDASVPFAKPNDHATLDFDWGVNAAVLFGRQKARVHHQTSMFHYSLAGYGPQRVYSTQIAAPPARSRTVTIPNVGGFAGVSLKFPNAKIALGYRADFFFGAVDNGIDTARKSDIGFYGPFATISVGFGG